MTQKRARRLLLVAAVLLGTAAAAQAADWELLGSRTVERRTDRDEIKVGEKEGTFRAIQLRVRRRGIELKDLRVHFGNGAVYDVQVRNFIPAGSQTRVIDLPGGARVIEKVVFYYQTRGRGRKRAVVELWGKG